MLQFGFIYFIMKKGMNFNRKLVPRDVCRCLVGDMKRKKKKEISEHGLMEKTHKPKSYLLVYVQLEQSHFIPLCVSVQAPYLW